MSYSFSIIDTHAHLDHIPEIDKVLQKAFNAGVTDIVAPGIDLETCRKNGLIKKQTSMPRIHLAMGMHPSEASIPEAEDLASFIDECRDNIVAVGEIGLDFWYKWVRKDKDKKDIQRAVFRTFLELAVAVDRPVIIHSRGAWRECYETAKSLNVQKAVFHYFSGPLDVLKDILSAGYYVSTTPSVAYSPPSREAMQYAPLEQTMIETDSPVYFRDENGEGGFHAEPKDVLKTLSAYCELKKIDQNEVLSQLNKNAINFFKLEDF